MQFPEVSADLTSQDFSKGLKTFRDVFKLTKEETPNCMDIKFEFDGNVSKRSGTSTMNTVALSATGSAGTLGVTTCGWAMFDFGAGSVGTRWLVVGGGTALWASSDLGFSFVRIASDRAATYQYFERSKNVLIACSDAYNQVLFWPGSAGTLASALAVSSAPTAKYAVNFQGFLILLNTNTRKRGFYWEDENTQLTGDYSDAFDLPSSADDETTAPFILSNKLYVSTRYKLYSVSFVGGNPDWAFREIRSWGFVPRTVRKITIGDIGEVVIGEDWNRHVRIFDGSQDKIVSDNVEQDNGISEFAMKKLSYAGSGMITNFAETDDNEQVYKLAVILGEASTQVTHFICFNARSMAWYPYNYSTPKFMSMAMAESGNRRYLVAMDQSGWLHMMDSGNTDRNTYAIDEYFDSPILYEKSPSQSSKSQKIDLFFAINSAGGMYYQDRVDFSSEFTTRRIFSITSSRTLIQHYESIDIPTTQNTYQYRLTSSSATTTPWSMNRVDYFLSGLGIGREVSR